MITYVTIMIFGQYEDRRELIVYAGSNIKKAEKACDEFVYPDPYNNFGIIQQWVKGQQIKSIDRRG